MELRNIQASDLFALVKMLKKLGIKDLKSVFNTEDIKSLREKSKNGEKIDYIEIGINGVMSIFTIIIENIDKIENDFYVFVGNIANTEPTEIATMKIDKFMELINEIVHKEEFKDFFNQALKLIKKV